jgi:VanZ family protein
LHLETPLVDWNDQPNRIDEVDLIAISPQTTRVIARRTPTSSSALRATVLVPEEGLTLRARGRRVVIDGPDLLFYTNPIQVFTESTPTGPRRPNSGTVQAPHLPTHSTSMATPSAAGGRTNEYSTSRTLPAWIPLGFIVAASLFTSLIDRWQLEIHRRFASLAADRKRGDSPAAIPSSRWRYFLVLLLGFVFLAVYGSLVPLQLAPMDWPTALARFQAILQEPVSLASRTDFATNVLLFIPIGFLAIGLVQGAQPSDWRRGIGIVLVVVACAGLSLTIEFGQLWVADRTSSQSDVVAETLGGLLGATAWLFLGPVLVAWLSRVLKATRPRGRIEHLLGA